MILKEAAFKFKDINPLVKESKDGNRMMRTASGKVIIEPNSAAINGQSEKPSCE